VVFHRARSKRSFVFGRIPMLQASNLICVQHDVEIESIGGSAIEKIAAKRGKR
jgi:hypothetical protein